MKRPEQYIVEQVTEANIKKFLKNRKSTYPLITVGNWIGYRPSELGTDSAIFSNQSREFVLSNVEKANKLHPIRDFSEAERYEFMNKIDFKCLEIYLSRLLSIDIHLSVKISEESPNGFKKLEFKSQDISLAHPIISAAWKSMVVSDFGCWLKADDNFECLEMSWDIVISYQSYKGGFNGTPIAYATYNAKKGWNFESAYESSIENLGGYQK